MMPINYVWINIKTMSNDLVKLHKSLSGKETVKDVKQKIKNDLQLKMRENFLELLEIGELIGYDHLKKEMKKAIELLDMLEKETRRK
jgi:hypothetical protein